MAEIFNEINKDNFQEKCKEIDKLYKSLKIIQISEDSCTFQNIKTKHKITIKL